MSPRKGERSQRLPEGWTPDLLDDLDREEFDHLAGYGLTPTEIIRRLGWSVEAVGRRAHRRTA